MSLRDVLTADDPAIAAEARRIELRRQFSNVRRIGRPAGGLETARNPARAVLGPFVGAAQKRGQFRPRGQTR